jgi:hypothetical protein
MGKLQRPEEARRIEGRRTEQLRPVRDAMRVVRHFSAGTWRVPQRESHRDG